ncbi:hypothetical protein ACFL1N_04800 [Thermodesulfobacteriota bacterium]
MKASDEISSTEKLLDLIQKGKPSEHETPLLNLQTNHKKKFFIERFFKINEKIGIHFGYRDIRLVKIRDDSKGSWRIIECRSEPLDFSDNSKIKDTNRSFRKILEEFCGDPKKIDIWCIMSSSKIEVRNIIIPKVPKGQISNVVKWTIKKEIKFDEKDSIIDFEIRDDVSDNGILKTSVMTFIVPRSEVDELKNLFYGAGFPLKGISIGSFAIQNLFRTEFLVTEKENSGNIYIGEDWSSIDIFSSGSLTLSRNIKTGVKGMIENLSGYIKDKHYENHSKTENSSSEHSSERLSKNILLNFCRNIGESEADFADADITETEILEAINPHFDRLIKQTERSFEHHALSMKNGEMNRIFLSGEIYAYKNMDKYISELIGIQTEMIDLPDPSANLPKPVQIPENIIDRACYVPAFGIALSDNSRTPNFLHTYEDKEEKEKVGRIERLSTIIFVLLSLISIIFFFYQGGLIEKKKSDIKASQYELQKYGPLADLNTVNQFVIKAKENQNELKAYAGRYLGLATISELSNLTPPEIKLSNLRVILNNDINQGKDKTAENNLTIEGSVSGKDTDLESCLAEYILSLENSPLFLQPVILNSTREFLDGEEDLLFTLNLTIKSD